MSRRLAESPFAGRSEEDVMARWIVWKSGEKEAEPKADQAPVTTAVVPADMRVRHQQYDAVMRRMKSLAGRAGAYTSTSI